MVATASQMLPLGTRAPEFSLPNLDGRMVSLADFAGAPAFVVMFLCNHCPYVKHVADCLAQLAREYQQQRGVAFVAINANDIEHYPDDAPEKMVEMAQQHGYPFPYLFDATQAVAKDYHAACTPDFYVFDAEQKLFYRGQMDDSRPGKGQPTGKDLRAALDILLADQVYIDEQKPSLGCNIKWKPGNEPDYF